MKKLVKIVIAHQKEINNRRAGINPIMDTRLFGPNGQKFIGYKDDFELIEKANGNVCIEFAKPDADCPIINDAYIVSKVYEKEMVEVPKPAPVKPAAKKPEQKKPTVKNKIEEALSKGK